MQHLFIPAIMFLLLGGRLYPEKPEVEPRMAWVGIFYWLVGTVTFALAIPDLEGWERVVVGIGCSVLTACISLIGFNFRHFEKSPV